MVHSDLPTTDDAVLGGRLRLLQPARGHRVGHDAILLAAAVPAVSGERALELGAGVGAAGLALAHRLPGLRVSLVEIDPVLGALAADNIARNGLSERVTVEIGDALAPRSGGYDHVLTNPPFLDPARHRVSADKSTAHMPSHPFAAWVAAATRLLREGGTLTAIHRADALREILAALDAFGGIEVMPVQPRADAPAIRVLIRARRGSRAPLAVRPPLVLAGADGKPTAEAEAILRGAAALP